MLTLQDSTAVVLCANLLGSAVGKHFFIDAFGCNYLEEAVGLLYDARGNERVVSKLEGNIFSCATPHNSGCVHIKYIKYI